MAITTIASGKSVFLRRSAGLDRAPWWALVCASLATAAVVSGCSSSSNSSPAPSNSTSDAGSDGPALTDCPGGPVDTQVDPANCGACGHDCRGSDCSAGACKPVLLGQNMADKSNTRPAVAGNFVYWINGDEDLERAATDGSGHKVVIGGGFVGAFFVADGGVYWAESINDGSPGSAVYFTPEGGQATLLAGNQYSPSAIVLQGTTLFWADYFSSGFNPGTIWSTPKTGGTAGAVMNNVNVMRMAPAPDGGLVVDAERQGGTNETPFLVSSSGQVTNLPTSMNLIRDLDASDSYAAWGDGQNLGVYSFSTKKTQTASIRAGAVAIMGNEVLVATDNGLEGVSLPDLADQVLLPDIQIDKLAAADGFVYIFRSDGALLRWTR